MMKTKFRSFIILGNIIFYFTACTSSKVPQSEGGFYHSGIYFGKYFPVNYQQGIADGCSTAKGTYTKAHSLFNKDNDYYQGWFLGRNRCRPLLVIENEIEKNNE